MGYYYAIPTSLPTLCGAMWGAVLLAVGHTLPTSARGVSLVVALRVPMGMVSRDSLPTYVLALPMW